LYQLFVFGATTEHGADTTVILGYRSGTSVSTAGGSSMGYSGIDAAIKGASFWGNQYTAGVAGFNYLDYPMSSGVLGSSWNGGIWGSLAYRDLSSTFWAGYFAGNVNVSGTMTIQGGTPDAGKVLTSDATGNATWQNVGSGAGFSVWQSASQTLSSGQINFDTVDYDDANAFASSAFTAPSAGVYHFDTHVRLNAYSSAGQYCWVAFNVNGSLRKECTGQSSTNTWGLQISSDIKLAAGDVVTVYLQGPGSVTTSTGGTFNTWFSGHKVY